jgi:hypothetical protein
MEHHTDELAPATGDQADADGQPEAGAGRRPARTEDDVAADRITDTESELSHDDNASLVDNADRVTSGDEESPLFEETQRQRAESEWESIQTGFVDEPRHAVERADTLVADLMQRLAASFAEERSQLEAQWDRGEDVSTEDLRLALQRYRSFFGRLLQA